MHSSQSLCVFFFFSFPHQLASDSSHIFPFSEDQPLQLVGLSDAREEATWKAESEEITWGEVGEGDEGAVAVGLELVEHLDEDLDELGIGGREVSLALVDNGRWKPFENGGPGGARIRAWGVGLGVVERDVGSEWVDELGVCHGRVGERLFGWKIWVLFWLGHIVFAGCIDLVQITGFI
jgi:hypothetical protein